MGQHLVREVNHVSYSYISVFYTYIRDVLLAYTYLVNCPSLADPNNGMINCSLGDDGVSSYEDACSFTCNTGYELIGQDIRFCLSNGTWNGNETFCSRGNNYIFNIAKVYVCA